MSVITQNHFESLQYFVFNNGMYIYVIEFLEYFLKCSNLWSVCVSPFLGHPQTYLESENLIQFQLFEL